MLKTHLPAAQYLARTCVVLLAVFGLLNQSQASNSLFTVRETPQAIIIATAGYEAAVGREGATLTVRRDGETVLDGWAASGGGGVFTKAGKPQRIGRLKTLSRQDAAVVLDYDIGAKDSLVRVEIRPNVQG
ncbi:MAG: hypothetical protein KA788_12000, partial [Lacunisphaera sp.]|nr:hypothetical protein [Lacunisphaera sp.]